MLGVAAGEAFGTLAGIGVVQQRGAGGMIEAWNGAGS
jgi:hypothetical protein